MGLTTTTVYGTSHTVTLIAGRQYRWNVAACDSTGCSSPTVAKYFQTPVAAPPPMPSNPTPGTTSGPGPVLSSTSVPLAWGFVQGASHYTINVRDILSNALSTYTANGTSYTVSLGAGRQYRWNVAACNANGCSEATQVRFFQTPGGDDHGNSCTAATAVVPNGTSAGTIGSAGDVDYFRIDVPSAGTLVVSSSGTTDTYGFLKSSACADLASDDDALRPNFKIERAVTAGTYYVMVRHYSASSTGVYALNTSFTASTTTGGDDGNSCDTATAIATDTTRTGSIGTANDVDFFRIEVPFNGALTVFTEGTTDTYGALKNSACTNVAFNENASGSNTNFRIIAKVMPGTYYIGVRHKTTNGTGAYTLKLSLQPLITATDRFTWPIDPTNPTDGHSGVCGDSSPCWWLHDTSESGVWRDAQRFGRKNSNGNGHLGADYNLNSGHYEYNELKDVFPAAYGKVIQVFENKPGWGNALLVKHETSFGSYTTLYAHIDWLPGRKPQRGELVYPNVPIAKVGRGAWEQTAVCSSGYLSFGTSAAGLNICGYPAHLHFEVRRNYDVLDLGKAYVNCNGSDSEANDCPQKQIDPNPFIGAHNN